MVTKMDKEKPIIEVKNIGKKYDIAHAKGGYVSLRDVLANVFRAPFSFLKSKAKQVAGFEKKEEFWALKDINFSINKGEVVGVIGANGAGKSTLLKILSQITPPTEGEVILRGRVGSLLEVGTGFHPELTGRENIFLNGPILGMKKKENEKKFDEIVAFAGIHKFLDTVVTHFSSGMYVRLAFSVAAHMEPDILLVDEVLAVGDAEFQKKCLGKMDQITKGEGRTIMFVSHNMAAVKTLCNRGILIKEGKIIKLGEINKVVDAYTSVTSNKPEVDIGIINHPLAHFNKIKITTNEGDISSIFDLNQDINIRIEYEVLKPIPRLQMSLSVVKGITEIVRAFDTDNNRDDLPTIEPGRYVTTCKFPKMFLKAGEYAIRATLGSPEKMFLDTGLAAGFSIQELSINTQHKSYKSERDGVVVSPAIWNKEKIN